MNDVRPPAPIDRHGVSHMKYMHARRRESAMKDRFKTAVGDQISKHVLPRLDNYNKRRAIRTSDLISLELRSGPGRELHTRVSGRGQYRRWTPATVLRTSFGRGWKASTRRRVQKKRAVDHLRPGTTQRNTQACSTAATADFFEAANNHVTYNRCAIALKYCKEASRYVKSRPNTRMGILEISYDASDQPATIDGDPAIYEMVMVTMKLTWFGEGRRHTEVINISCPPVFVEDTSAETLLQALLARLPVSFQTLLGKCQILVIVPNSDPHI